MNDVTDFGRWDKGFCGTHINRSAEKRDDGVGGQQTSLNA